MMKQNLEWKKINGGFRLWRAFCFSMCGLKTAFQDHAAFKQEVILTVLIIPFVVYLNLSVIESALLIGSWVLVLIVEIINSAIESVVDRISLEIHPLSKKIKDMGSAAVFLSIVNAIIIWLIVLINNYN